MYESIKLNYEYDELEPYIDTKTVGLHYNTHYLRYLEKLNKILKDNGYDFKYSKVELINHIDEFPLNIRDDILFNLGGVLNHELYFKNMNPKKSNKPTGKIKNAIDKKYGNYENFKKEFKNITRELVGSGYTNLVMNKNKKLNIINTSNQEIPYLYGFIPLISLDLWEHAYYINYQNNKDDYIDAFFEIIDFDYINKIYEENL